MCIRKVPVELLIAGCTAQPQYYITTIIHTMYSVFHYNIKHSVDAKCCSYGLKCIALLISDHLGYEYTYIGMELFNFYCTGTQGTLSHKAVLPLTLLR